MADWLACWLAVLCDVRKGRKCSHLLPHCGGGCSTGQKVCSSVYSAPLYSTKQSFSRLVEDQEKVFSIGQPGQVLAVWWKGKGVVSHGSPSIIGTSHTGIRDFSFAFTFILCRDMIAYRLIAILERGRMNRFGICVRPPSPTQVPWIFVLRRPKAVPRMGRLKTYPAFLFVC